MPTTDELAAQLAALQGSTPTLEELLFSDTIVSWNGGTTITGSTRFTLLVAPIPLRILSVSISSEYQTLAASDVAYWTCALEHGTGPAGFPDLAVRSTQNTGANANGGITARLPWTFDAAAWLSTDVAAGELLTVNWYPTGSVAALQFPQTYTVRYRSL
jgi:hypothetical protein